jgi:hypothetical protein
MSNAGFTAGATYLQGVVDIGEDVIGSPLNAESMELLGVVASLMFSHSHGLDEHIQV